MKETVPGEHEADAVRALFFGDDGELGSPAQPTLNGQKALFAAGKEIWNQWRRVWPKAQVNFAGWKENGSRPDFSGYEFGDSALFVDTTFGQGADFIGAKFGANASFSRAIFGDETSFCGASFDEGATFQGARFGSGIDFSGATFLGITDFESTSFANNANFFGVMFDESVYFNSAHFGDDASFEWAQLGKKRSDFNYVIFGYKGNFHGAQFADKTYFKRATFGHRVTFNGGDLKTAIGIWRNVSIDNASFEVRTANGETQTNPTASFREVYFSGAQFKGAASFQNREFFGATDFGPFIPDPENPVLHSTSFGEAPEFHGSTLHENTSFALAEFELDTSPAATLSYRTLKKAMAQQQAIRAEQRFHQLEMSAENALSHGHSRILFSLYRSLSNYGYSVVRPLVFMSITAATIGMLHALLISPRYTPSGAEIRLGAQWAQYILLNSLPLPGFDKLQQELRAVLFGTEAPFKILLVVVLDLVHKACSLVSLFLIGLALRNLFKIKS